MQFVKRLGGALAAGLFVSLSVGAIDVMAQSPSPTPPSHKAVHPAHKTTVTRSSKTAVRKATPQSPTARAAATAPRSLTRETTHKMKGVGEQSSGIILNPLSPANNESNASNPSQPRIPGVN